MSVGSLVSVGVPSWLPVWPLAVIAAVLLSLGFAIRLVRPRGAWGRLLRSRFLLGVPWGTLLTVAGVVAVYLFVQGGLDDPRNPLVIPFRSWSYFYPLGIVSASFTHAGLGHLTGNVFGTLTFAPIAEFAWGHFPRDRGSQTFTGVRTNPYVRLLAVPAASIVVGLLTGLFALGPVIGFSGVVFAIAGFALVFYPITTVVALAGGQVLRLLYRAIRAPVIEAEVSSRIIDPWFAGIALQGHVIGLLFGVLTAGLLAARRDYRPPAGRLWLATVVFGVGQSLWAVYWFRGGGRYVLFRAAGIIGVFLLAALLTTAMTATDRPLIELIDLRRREAAVGLLVALTIAICVPAVIVNLVVVDDVSGMDGIEIDDYTVTYAEDVPNQQVSVLNVSLFGETTQVNTSGVIVVSERRNVFLTATSKARLADQGRTSVRVGGVGWHRTVVANRTGWRVVGNDTTYMVHLRYQSETRLAYTADPSSADARIEGRRMQLRPTESAFRIRVSRGNRTLGTTPVPTPGENATAGGLTFNRSGSDLYASRNDTRVHIASNAGG